MLIDDLATRLAAASAVLSQLAERDGRVAELMRLRLYLERIVASGDERSVELAREALRW